MCIRDSFYTLSVPLIARFYAGRPTLGDQLRVVSGKPPVPVGQAVAAALKTQPQQIRTSA